MNAIVEMGCFVRGVVIQWVVILLSLWYPDKQYCETSAVELTCDLQVATIKQYLNSILA